MSIADALRASEPDRRKANPPVQPHDCNRCIYLGQTPYPFAPKRDTWADCTWDWYWCPDERFSSRFGGSIIARFGERGAYHSFPVQTVIDWYTGKTRNSGPSLFVDFAQAMLEKHGIAACPVKRPVAA